MAKQGNQKWDATDDFILDQWPKARDLSVAYRRTVRKMLRRLKRIWAELETILLPQGYKLYMEPDWAEFKVYRPEWCSKDGEPLVVLAVGAVFPIGFFKVEEAAAYRMLYLEGFDDESTDLHRKFADALYKDLGGRPDEWKDRTSEGDWVSPLWAEIPDTSDSVRVALARNPQDLKQFVLGEFQRLFTLSDALSRVVPEFLKLDQSNS